MVTCCQVLQLKQEQRATSQAIAYSLDQVKVLGRVEEIIVEKIIVEEINVEEINVEDDIEDDLSQVPQPTWLCSQRVGKPDYHELNFLLEFWFWKKYLFMIIANAINIHHVHDDFSWRH